MAGVISCSLRHYSSRYRFILCFTMHTTAPPFHPSRHYCSITAAWSSYHFTPSVTPFGPFLAFPRLSAITILVTTRLHFVTKQSIAITACSTNVYASRASDNTREHTEERLYQGIICLGAAIGNSRRSVLSTWRTESRPRNSWRRVKVCGRKPPKFFRVCSLASGEG